MHLVMVAVSVAKPALRTSGHLGSESRLVHRLPHDGGSGLAGTVFHLEEGGLRGILGVAVADAGAQADHVVAEAEDGLARPEVGGEVLVVGLGQLHGEHSVPPLQRGGSGKLFGRACHEGSGARIVQQVEGQVDGRGTRQAVPVPAVLHKAAGLARLAAHDLHGAVALVASVAVVLGVDFRAPHVGVIALEGHHPVAAAEDARRAVVVNKEALGSRGRLYALLLEETGLRRVLAVDQAQVVGGQLVVERLVPARQVARKRQLGKGLDIRRPHLAGEGMTSADARPPLVQVTIVAHRDEGACQPLTSLQRRNKLRT